ncbi:MAG: hypothetical protein WA865_01340 [Spirulinaceae cyanobacterium]
MVKQVMNQAVRKDSKEQILAAFNRLFTEQKNTESKVATKEGRVN